jgi:RNA polymerase sigma factor (TIGR02999 family)
MSSPNTSEITAWLRAWQAGDEDAYGRVSAILYDELKRRASYCLRGENARVAIEATALVHEAFIRLSPARDIDWKDRLHFLAVAARTMRRVLVDIARADAAAKRGLGAVHVTLDSNIPEERLDAVDLVALETALQELATVDARKVSVVEMRFFGGLTVEETAQILNVSADTVARDWRLARAWLKKQLQTECPE